MLCPERAATWIPRMVEAANGVPLEAHFHNTTGISTLNYLTAAKAGIHILHTAIGPDGQRAVHAVGRHHRRQHASDRHSRRTSTSPLIPADPEHLRRAAEAEGYTLGAPREYNLAHSATSCPAA